MKVFKYVLVIVLCWSTKISSAQRQLQLSYPSEVRNGIFFISKSKSPGTFFLFGNDAQVFKNQIFAKNSVLPPTILPDENTTGISVPNKHTGVFTWDDNKWWIVSRGNILLTEDAGDNWRTILSLTPKTQYTHSSYFTDIYFPSENVGFAVGTADKIFRTLDGGETWEQLQWSTSTAPYRRLSSVYFVNDSTGFALGYETDDITLNIGSYKPLYYFTTDAGESWSETTFPESDHHYVNIDVVDETTWYLSFVNRNFVEPIDKIYKSIDAGQNWTEVDLPGLSLFSSMVIRDMHWFTANEGILLGSTQFLGLPSQVYKTFDGGETWTPLVLNEGISPFFGKVPNLVMEFNGDEGLISGATGNILYSGNRGDSWQTIRTGLPDVSEISSSNGIIYAALYGNLLLKYDAQGWTEVDLPEDNQHGALSLLKVDNSGEGGVATIDVFGSLHLKCDDCGSWKSFYTNSDTTALDISFSKDKLSAIVYSNKKLLFFPDVEQTFFEQIADNVSIPSSENEMFRVGLDIFIKTGGSLFRRTGNHWNQVEIQGADVKSVQIDRAGNAIAYFNNDGYYVSNDTLKTWLPVKFSEEISNKIDIGISKISGYGQLNSTTHYAIVHGSTAQEKRYGTYILISHDGGKNWVLKEEITYAESSLLGKVAHAVDSKGSLWLGIANGAIFEWLTDDLILSADDLTPRDCIVYPNPTTGSFKVNIPAERDPASYEIFDIQGHLIDRGFLDQNGKLEISSQNLEGLYFLHLAMPNGETKTLRVLKK